MRAERHVVLMVLQQCLEKKIENKAKFSVNAADYTTPVCLDKNGCIITQ
jgi:hypothetical protein